MYQSENNNPVYMDFPMPDFTVLGILTITGMVIFLESMIMHYRNMCTCFYNIDQIWHSDSFLDAITDLQTIDDIHLIILN